MRLTTILGLGLLLASASPALADEVKTPQEIYGTRPNNLANIPAGWAVGNPIQLQVLFNLKAPVNSPEANAFLAEYGRFERSLPFNGRITISRVVAPAKYAYAGRLVFANWHEYQLYEKSAVFRKWYVAVWKPAVSEVDELFTVLDIAATGT